LVSFEKMSFILQLWNDLSEWLYSLLSSAGMANKEASLVVLGLDNAGKTSLLHKLKENEIREFVPTQRAQIQQFSVANLHVRAWDLGGHEPVRSMWQDYIDLADAILFVVDSADVQRFSEARDELWKLVSDRNLDSVPLLIVSNKIDLQVAVDRHTLADALGIGALERDGTLDVPCSSAGNRGSASSSSSSLQAPTKREGAVRMFRCSMAVEQDRSGLLPAFEWLAEQLQ
jgi:GTP-binding protein SAR1